MQLYFFLLVHYAQFIFSLTLNWRPRFPKYYKGNVFTSFETVVNLPLDYSSNRKSTDKSIASHHKQQHTDPSRTDPDQKTIPVFIRSFRRGNPDKHVWILNGGPGGSNELYSELMSLFESNDAFDNTWFYIMDQRGTGKSGDTACKPEECSKCLSNVKQCLDNKNVRQREINFTNSAQDLISIVNAIKKEHSGSSLFAISSGWGATLLYKALTIQPDLFERILFEDFASSIRSTVNDSAHDIGLNLIDSCLADKWCNKQFSNNRQSLLSIIQRLEDPNKNKCTKSLRMHNEFSDIGSSSDLRPVVQYLIHAIMKSFDISGSIITLSLLKHLDECRNINSFNSLLFSIVKGMVSEDDLLKMQGIGINEFVRIYDTYSELETVDFRTCSKNSLNNFTNICVVQERFVKSWRPMLQEFSYKPDKVDSIESINVNNVIHYGGKLDTLTPFDSGNQMIFKIHPNSIVISLSNYGHGSLYNEVKKCRRSLYIYLFNLLDSDKSEFQTCLDSLNTNFSYEKSLTTHIDTKLLWPDPEMLVWKYVGIICLVGIGIIILSLVAVISFEIYQSKSS